MEKTNTQKRFLTILLSLALIIVASFAFAGCDFFGNANKNEQNQYTPSDNDDISPTSAVNYTISVQTNLANAVISGAGTYKSGTEVTLTLTECPEGYYLDRWSTNERTDSIKVVADSNKTITATFEKGQSLIVNDHKVAFKGGAITVWNDYYLRLRVTDDRECSYTVLDNQIVSYQSGFLVQKPYRDSFYEAVNKNFGVIMAIFTFDDPDSISSPSWATNNDPVLYSSFTSNLNSSVCYATKIASYSTSSFINDQTIESSNGLTLKSTGVITEYEGSFNQNYACVETFKVFYGQDNQIYVVRVYNDLLGRDIISIGIPGTTWTNVSSIVVANNLSGVESQIKNIGIKAITKKA